VADIGKVTIINAALLHLGQDRISSPADDSQRARYALERYDMIRQEVLVSVPWNCARELAALSQLATDPAWGWAYQYSLPDDCLLVLRMGENTNEWKVKGRKLLTNADSANIEYIFDLEDPAVMTPLLRECIAMKLASELAVRVASMPDARSLMIRRYEECIAKAGGVEATESSLQKFIVREWDDAHYGFEGGAYRGWHES
jgi:hypothetical protein